MCGCNDGLVLPVAHTQIDKADGFCEQGVVFGMTMQQASQVHLEHSTHLPQLQADSCSCSGPCSDQRMLAALFMHDDAAE